MKTVNILFVCTGNTCRSPMAEGIFRSMLSENDTEFIKCSSAGLSAVPGDYASENAVLALREKGVDISSHRAKRLSGEDLPLWDVFFVMTETHAFILERAGVPVDRIYVPKNISDPYGGSLEDYRMCRDKISSELEKFLNIIRGKLEENNNA
ncbi:MAG: low molecular weight protein arginine phosphatase [Clostridia bacterium]|nr:low molecular weight protein arginine phosphatase [Clostridia bacterium]